MQAIFIRHLAADHNFVGGAIGQPAPLEHARHVHVAAKWHANDLRTGANFARALPGPQHRHRVHVPKLGRGYLWHCIHHRQHTIKTLLAPKNKPDVVRPARQIRIQRKNQRLIEAQDRDKHCTGSNQNYLRQQQALLAPQHVAQRQRGPRRQPAESRAL